MVVQSLSLGHGATHQRLMGVFCRFPQPIRVDDERNSLIYVSYVRTRSFASIAGSAPFVIAVAGILGRMIRFGLVLVLLVALLLARLAVHYNGGKAVLVLINVLGGLFGGLL